MKNIYPFKKDELQYPYDALEPYIDEETMHYHYDKHFQTYIENSNKILSNYSQFHKPTLEEMIVNIASFPYEIQQDLKNNLGGVYNHEMYFNIINPYYVKGGNNELINKINGQYGSIDKFYLEFEKMAKKVFGSGYTFLVLNALEELDIVNTHNQDVPIRKNLKPILLIDNWEHAYYLKHKNNRAQYIKDFFNVINFDVANQIYLNALNNKLCSDSFDVKFKCE